MRILCRLALTPRGGGRSLGELARHLTADEWATWLAFYELEPFGPRQEEVRAAVAAAAAANAWGAKAKPADFFPSLAPTREEREASNRARWLALCPAAAARHGEKQIREPNR